MANDVAIDESGSRDDFVPATTRTHDLIQILQTHWAIIVSFVAIGWGAAVSYWYVTPSTFESEAQLIIMSKNPRLATMGVQDGNAGRVSEDVLSTHMQIVQSHRIIAEALKTKALGNMSSIAEVLKPKQSPEEYIRQNLHVTRGGDGMAKKALVLNLAFQHSEPYDTQKVVEALIARYQRFVSKQFEDVNEQAADLITTAREELEAELEDAEQALVEARKNAPMLWDGTEGHNIHRSRFEEIQLELSTLRLEAANTRSRLGIVQEALQNEQVQPTTIMQKLALIDDQNLTRLGIFAEVFGGAAQTPEFLARAPFVSAAAQAEAEGLLQLMAKERTLAKDFGPRHPELEATRDQVEVIRSYMNDKGGLLSVLGSDFTLTPDGLVDAYARVLMHDLDSFERREKELLALAGEEEEAAKELVVFELEDETLHKQVDRRQRLFDATVDRLRDINLAKDYGGFINEVIAAPSYGEEVWPKLSICLALGILAGGFLGVGCAFAAEYFDRSFRDADELTEVLDLPLLASVPKLAINKDAQPDEALVAVDKSICVLHEPQAPSAEVFRGLRTQLFFANKNQKLNLLSITSPKPGDGKSTITSNFTASLAQAGRRVLLVDCDMRRPRLNTLFGIENQNGLADAITGRINPWETVHQIGHESIWFLPAGANTPNPAELLDSTEFDEFLDEAQERYDFVVLDCPPVLRVADPCIIASKVDGVLLAMRVSQDTKPEAIRTRELLTHCGANVVGIVANCWDLGGIGGGSGYGSYGYGDYGYGDYTADEPELKAS